MVTMSDCMTPNTRTNPNVGFSEWLRHARESRSLTLIQLAEKTGYSHVTIHNIEQGKKGARRKTVESIVKGLFDTQEAQDYAMPEALEAAGFIASPASGRTYAISVEGKQYRVFSLSDKPLAKAQMDALIAWGLAEEGRNEEL